LVDSRLVGDATFSDWAALCLVAFAEAQRRRTRTMGDFLKALLAAFIAFAIFTFPATWLLMLFFGNIGWGLSYVGSLPLGILVSILLGGVLSRPW
jgi:hypothetical protein